MPRKGYTNLTINNPVIIEFLEIRRKQEHRRSIAETVESILIDVLEIPEAKL